MCCACRRVLIESVTDEERWGAETAGPVGTLSSCSFKRESQVMVGLEEA